jgi:GAF domain-containing protein
VRDTADPPRVHLELPAHLESVGRARQALVEAASDWGVSDDVLQDARLVVSELVTNAVLHAATPLVLSAWALGSGMRIEVCDSSSRPVIPPLLVPAPAPGLLDDIADVPLLDEGWVVAGATGRGLAMVDEVADAWGVEHRNGTAKVVWAEVGTGLPVEAPATEPEVSAPVSGGHPIRLIAVPLRLLAESERQFDDLLRELQVLALDPASPARLKTLADVASELIGQVEEGRRVTREAIREAVSGGDRLVDLSFILRADGLVGLSRLGELLTKAAAAAAAGELLTLPPAGEVVAFRVWYRDEVVAQLGGRPPQPCPFPVLPDTAPHSGRRGPGAALHDAAVERLGAARQGALNELRARLAAAGDDSAVCQAVLAHLLAAGAHRGAICLVEEDHETIELVCETGFSADVRDHWRRFSVSSDLPASEAIRTGRTVLLRTVAERNYRYPVFATTPVDDDPTTLCVPVRAPGGPVLGCLVMGLTRSREFSDAELGYLNHVAGELGESLSGHQQSREAAVSARHEQLVRRVEGLAAGAGGHVSPGGDDKTGASEGEIAGATTADGVVRQTLALVTGELADWCGIYRRGADGRPLLVAGRHREPAKQALVDDLQRRWPPGPESAAAVCLQTGSDRVFQVVTDAALADAARGDDHLQLLRQLGLGSGAVVPAVHAGRVVGVLAFANNRGAFVSPAHLSLARRVAEALAPALAGPRQATADPSRPPG